MKARILLLSLFFSFTVAAQSFVRTYELPEYDDASLTERFFDFYAGPENEITVCAGISSPTAEPDFLLLAKLAADGEARWSKKLTTDSWVRPSGVRVLPTAEGSLFFVPGYGGQQTIYNIDNDGVLLERSSYDFSINFSEQNESESIEYLYALPPSISNAGTVLMPYAYRTSVFGLVEMNPSDGAVLNKFAFQVGNFDPYYKRPPSPDGSFLLAGGNKVDHSLMLSVVESDGSVRWQHHLPRISGNGFGSTVTDELLIVDGDLPEGTAVMAFRLSDGTLAWSKLFPYRFTDQGTYFDQPYYAPQVIGNDGKSVFLIQTDPYFLDATSEVNRYYAMDITSGALQRVSEVKSTKDDSNPISARPDVFFRVKDDGASGSLLAEVSPIEQENLRLVRLSDNPKDAVCSEIGVQVDAPTEPIDFSPTFGQEMITVATVEIFRLDRRTNESVNTSFTLKPTPLNLIENCTNEVPPVATTIDTNDKMQISPNPATNELLAVLPLAASGSEATMELLDLSGRVLKRYQGIVPAEGMRLTLPRSVPGIYLLRATTDGKSMTRRVVISGN